MTSFIPVQSEADIDLATRNKMMGELIAEEITKLDGQSEAYIENHIKTAIIDKFNINHPEYQACVSYDVTSRGTFITAWVTRRLALVRFEITKEEETKCNKSRFTRMMDLVSSSLKSSRKI